MTSSELLTAGRFSSLTLLSAKALRIYAERGLLLPSRVDPDNGYRYYGLDQVHTGWLIGLLRSADLPLDEIDKIIQADPDTGARLVERASADLERQTGAKQAVLHRVRLHLNQESSMSAVETTLVPDQAVLSVQRRMRPDEMDGVITSTVARLRGLATESRLTMTGDPFGIFHAPITDDSDGPLEIVLPVDGLVERLGDGADEVRSYRLAGGLVALRHAEGRETDFPEILALYDEVHTWITGAGRVPVGPPREIWHNSPRDPEPLSLTIAWPYATPPAATE